MFKRVVGSRAWNLPLCWTARALRDCGWDVKCHPTLQSGIIADTSDDLTQADLLIYTHTTEAHVNGFSGPQWFVKSTIPDEFHTTIDTLGYGPHSHITFNRPPFESVTDVELQQFFDVKVPQWRQQTTSKWGRKLFDTAEVTEEDYILVIGQTFCDETVTGMWFGDYWKALQSVVSALTKTTDRPIVVKLHPWTDGTGGVLRNDGKPAAPTTDVVCKEVTKQLKALGQNVHVYSGMTSIHSFLENARCVVLCNSGSGLEALFYKKPVIAWGLPEYHWVSYDLRHLCSLPEALRLEWFDEKQVAQFICWYVDHYCVYDYPSTLRRVKHLLATTTILAG